MRKIIRFITAALAILSSVLLAILPAVNSIAVNYNLVDWFYTESGIGNAGYITPVTQYFTPTQTYQASVISIVYTGPDAGTMNSTNITMGGETFSFNNSQIIPGSASGFYWFNYKTNNPVLLTASVVANFTVNGIFGVQDPEMTLSGGTYLNGYAYYNGAIQDRDFLFRIFAQGNITAPNVTMNGANFFPSAGSFYPAYNATINDDGGGDTSLTFRVRGYTSPDWLYKDIPYTVNVTTGESIYFYDATTSLSPGARYWVTAIVTNQAGTSNSTTLITAPTADTLRVILNSVTFDQNRETGIIYPTFNASITNSAYFQSIALKMTFIMHDITDSVGTSYETTPPHTYNPGDEIVYTPPSTWAYVVGNARVPLEFSPILGHTYEIRVRIATDIWSAMTAPMLYTVTIPPAPPVVETVQFNSIGFSSNSSMTIRGRLITTGNLSTNVSFRYRIWQTPVTWNGTDWVDNTVAWTYTTNVSAKSGNEFYRNISSLNTSATYEFQALAFNSQGNSTGGSGIINFGIFSNAAGTTVGIDKFDVQRIIQFNGYITTTGNLTGYYLFEYSKAGQNKWIATNQTFYANNFTGLVSYNVTGLEPQTNYDYRLVLSNLYDPHFACNTQTFMTSKYPTLKIATGNATPLYDPAQTQYVTTYSVIGIVNDVYPTATVWMQYHIGAPTIADDYGNFTGWIHVDTTTIDAAGNYTFFLMGLPQGQVFTYRFAGLTTDNVSVNGSSRTIQVEKAEPLPPVTPSYNVTIATWKAEEIGLQAYLFGNITRLDIAGTVYFQYRLKGGGTTATAGGSFDTGVWYDTYKLAVNATESVNSTTTYRFLTPRELLRNTTYEYKFRFMGVDGVSVDSYVKEFKTSLTTVDPDAPPNSPEKLTNSLLTYLGLNTAMGKWIALLFLILMATGAGIFLALKMDGTARDMTMIITLMANLGIIGWFTFGGILDSLAVIILVIIAGGLLLLMGSRAVANR